MIKTTINLLLLALFAGLTLVIYLVLPLWLLPRSAAWLLLVPPAILVTTANWALIHEAIHRAMHPNPRVNDHLGRLLCLLFGSPFRVLRFGHLMHHRFNRTELDRSEIREPETRPAWSAGSVYYLKLLGGLYLAELAAGLLFLLPRRRLQRLADRLYDPGREPQRAMHRQIERDLLTPVALREIRQDGLAALVLLSTAFGCYAGQWYWLMLFLLGRGLLISLVDNAFHYGTPLGDVRYSLNLRLPRWADSLVLNFNYHRVHHRYPNLPWHRLPERHRALGDSFEYGFLHGVLRQLRGPLRASSLPRADG